jgi:hypothetical protein
MTTPKTWLTPLLWMGAGAVLVYLLLAASASKETTSKAATKRAAENKAAADQVLKKGTTTQLHYTDEGQLVLLEIPSRDKLTGLIEIKRCYVWRDAAYLTTAMACEGANEDRFDLAREDNGTFAE